MLPRRALATLCMLAFPVLALHCGGFVGNGDEGQVPDAAGSRPDALAERDTSGDVAPAVDAGVDAGYDGGDWVTVLAPQPATNGGADAAPPAVFARSLVKFGGSEGQLVFSGALRGALGAGDGSVADGLDTLLVYLNPAGETQRIEVDSQPGPQFGDSILTTETQGLFALSLVGAEKQTNARFAKGVGSSFGAARLLGDTRDGGFIARGNGDRVLYAGNKDNGDLLIGNITDTTVATEKIGEVLITAASRFGADFVLAGSAQPGTLAVGTCISFASPLKHVVLGLEATGLLLGNPEARCSFRGVVTGTTVAIDAVTEVPAVPNSDAGDNGFLLVAGRAKGSFYYLLGDAGLDNEGKPIFVPHETFDAGPNGSVFLLSLDRKGAFLNMRMLRRNLNDGECYVRALAGRADGSIVMAGSLNATMDFGGGALPYAGGSDGFVATLNHDLSHRWSTSFGDGNDQSVNAVAPGDKDTLYVAGVARGALGLRGAVIPPGVQSAFVARLTAP